MTKKKKSLEKSLEIVKKVVRQLQQKKGKYYERWKKGIQNYQNTKKYGTRGDKKTKKGSRENKGNDKKCRKER